MPTYTVLYKEQAWEKSKFLEIRRYCGKLLHLRRDDDSIPTTKINPTPH